MYIRVDELEARKRRSHTYAIEDTSLPKNRPGIVAVPLQAVSRRYDRQSLDRLLKQWQTEEQESAELR
jgi:hypothetical protein